MGDGFMNVFGFTSIDWWKGIWLYRCLKCKSAMCFLFLGKGGFFF